jgi:hypothetical protein
VFRASSALKPLISVDAENRTFLRTQQGVVTARHKNFVQFIPHKTALFILEQFLFKKQQNKRQLYATAK